MSLSFNNEPMANLYVLCYHLLPSGIILKQTLGIIWTSSEKVSSLMYKESLYLPKKENVHNYETMITAKH